MSFEKVQDALGYAFEDLELLEAVYLYEDPAENGTAPAGQIALADATSA